MLDQTFSKVVADVIGFVNDDLSDTLSCSLLSQKIAQLRKSVELASTDLEQDKVSVRRVRKSIKAVHRSGRAHQQCEADMSSVLADLSENALKDGATAVGNALAKFSAAFGQINFLLGNLMQSLSNVMFSPLDTFVNTELKIDLRKSVDRALKDYEARTEKSRKERLQSARDSRVEASPAEAADGLDRERRSLQLQLCEFLITAADVKGKRQSALVQYLSDYCVSQLTYFKECLGTLQQLDSQMRGMADSLEAARCEQERERRSLVKLRDDLRSVVASERDPNNGGAPGAYSLHQNQGNRAHGTAKHGYLLKRSGSKVKKVWQKRRAAVSNGCFLLYHADDSQAPVSLPLLTCQVRPASSDRRGHGRGAFSLVSNNRTYSFQCDSIADAEHWVSVLSNAKVDAFQAAMDNGGDVAVGGTAASCYSPAGLCGGADSLRAAVLLEVRSMPGNQMCADCSTVDPEWISTNLGILICLECCGIHRDLGVHVSRTQSLLMDDLTPAQLLASRCIGNALFNEVFEAVLPDGVKPGSSVDWGRADLQQQMSQRKAFIRAKYRERSFVCRTITTDATPEDRARSLARDLASAVRHRRVPLLLQAFAEGCDLMVAQQPVAEGAASSAALGGETPLHSLLRESSDFDADDGEADINCLRRLAVLEFALQNSPPAAQRRVTDVSLETLAHYCVRYNRPESLRVCLRAPGLTAPPPNADGLSPIELCARLGGRDTCAMILRAVESGNLSVLDNPGDSNSGGAWRLVGGGGGPPLSSEASYPDLSLCSEDISCELAGGGSFAAVSRAESPSRQSSGESSSGAAAAAVVAASRRAVTPNKSKAPLPKPLPPPPLPPLPATHRRLSSGCGDSYDSVQIVIDAAMESFLSSAMSPPPPPLPLKPKPKPLPKPKPRLARASMPPMQLQSLAAEAAAVASAAASAAAANSPVSAEDSQPANSTSF